MHIVAAPAEADHLQQHLHGSLVACTMPVLHAEAANRMAAPSCRQQGPGA